MQPKLLRGWLVLPTFVLCAGVSSAATFSYSISCSALTIGPDQIQAYSQSGSVNLVPNVANVSNTVDFFNGSTNVFRNNASATFNGTLPCSFTLGGVTVSANRGFSLVVAFSPVVGAARESAASRPQLVPIGQETHTFTFQAFSFDVVIPGQGTVTVSQGTHVDGITIQAPVLSAGAAALVLNVDPASSSLLFVPLPAPIPVPPSIFLTLTGLAGTGWYEIRRRKMAALRG
ncbi:MAG TPA: hypothetical protein VEU96_26345 [Bryobacteraceae bacterium]|nr:hypothetical protein [Bryobacteraceae bacterium]